MQVFPWDVVKGCQNAALQNRKVSLNRILANDFFALVPGILAQAVIDDIVCRKVFSEAQAHVRAEIIGHQTGMLVDVLLQDRPEILRGDVRNMKRTGVAVPLHK